MSLFSKIAAGEIPSYKVAADQHHFAFLDINPVAPGHVLVIPRKEVSYLFDLTDQEYTDLLLFAKKVARALQAAVPCRRIGVAVIGLEVPHAHIHLLPLNTEKDIDFSHKTTLPDHEMQRLATAIAEQFAAQNP